MPVNVGNGLKVTVPSPLTVYVPSPGTVRDIWVQLLGDSAGLMPHNFTEVACNGKSVAPRVSLANGVYVWFVSYASRIASAVADGGGGKPTVGVIVSSTKRFKESLA